MLRVRQPESVVRYRVVTEQLLVEQANRNCGPQIRVTLARLQLIDVHRAGVVDQPLQQPGKNRNLHLDVQPPARRIASPDVQHDKLVVREFLVAERIENLDVDDRIGELENGVEQTDQNGDVLWTAKNLLEHEIDGWFDSQQHGIPASIQVDCSLLRELYDVRLSPSTGKSS